MEVLHYENPNSIPGGLVQAVLGDPWRSFKTMKGAGLWNIMCTFKRSVVKNTYIFLQNIFIQAAVIL